MAEKKRSVPGNGQDGKKVLNLLDAISLIQQAASTESGAGKATIDAMMFTPSMQVEFITMGALWAFISTLMTMAIAPLAIMVLDGNMEAFGGHGNHPVFDKGFVITLAFFSSIAFSWIVASLARFYVGNYARQAISALLHGMAWSAAISLLVAVIVYGAIYNGLEPAPIADWMVLHSSRWLTLVHLRKVYDVLMSFRAALPKAAIFLVITKVIFIVLPQINLYRHKSRLVQDALKEDDEF